MRILQLIGLFAGCSAYKYLIYNPTIGYSHMQYMCAIGDTLANAGHDVTIFTPVGDVELMKRPCVLNEKIKTIKPLLSQEFQDLLKYQSSIIQSAFWSQSSNPMEIIKHLGNVSKIFKMGCEDVLQLRNTMQELRDEHFDVGISEPMSLCGFGIFHALDIQNVISSPSFAQMDTQSWSMGEPLAPSYVPGVLSDGGEKMGFFGRLKNALATIIGLYFYKFMLAEEHEMLKSRYPNIKSIEGLFGDASFVFINSQPYFNYPRPLLHKTVEIGGITVENANISNLKLDEKWDKILDERPETVLVSFGTIMNAKNMPDLWKKTIIEAFSELPDVTFIWKYEGTTDIAQDIDNVHMASWLPQKVLLNDPRLSLFISHAGLGSVTEIAYLGVPSITIPIFADQPRNAAMLARHGGSLVIDKLTLQDKEALKEAIRSVLDDPTYKENAKTLSSTMQNRPIKSSELVVKHAEFVAKYGPLRQLDSYSRYLTIIQVYFVDIIVSLIVILSICTALTGFCCIKICRRFKNNKVIHQDDEHEELFKQSDN